MGCFHSSIVVHDMRVFLSILRTRMSSSLSVKSLRNPFLISFEKAHSSFLSKFLLIPLDNLLLLYSIISDEVSPLGNSLITFTCIIHKWCYISNFHRTNLLTHQCLHRSHPRMNNRTLLCTLSVLVFRFGLQSLLSFVLRCRIQHCIVL